jgi:Histidine kinase-, DNA gyrase B-, and HSP90-like ATPase
MVRPTKVDANPTKAFFVRMITRDIALEDCILDLVDNSVDGAWRLEGGRPMGLHKGADLSAYRVDINTGGGRFSIKDNCGGIDLDDAVEYAFTFGRKEDEAQEGYSIGVYGIGMKRAVFKMGKTIEIRSTYRTANGRRESFVVPIDVDEWMSEKTTDWDFDLQQSDHLSKPGVQIIVDDLNDSTKSRS